MELSLLRTSEEIERIYRQYVGTVYRIALMMLKNIPEAEDATQTVFIRFMAAEQAFNGDEHIKAWLIVTVKNHCRDVLRSAWRTRRVHSESLPETAQFAPMLEGDLFQQVMALQDKYKLPLYLYYYEGYKSQEIAEMLSVNHATIRTRLKTAKKKLKLMLEEETNGE